ncbi:MAG: hypothetical protein IPK95_12170 [Cellvibrionales bacterium]|nr:hypothetical protein [Cellvibrionales bacterium]
MMNESVLDFSRLPRVQLSTVELAYTGAWARSAGAMPAWFPDNACSWLPMLESLAAQGLSRSGAIRVGYHRAPLPQMVIIL